STTTSPSISMATCRPCSAPVLINSSRSSCTRFCTSVIDDDLPLLCGCARYSHMHCYGGYHHTVSRSPEDKLFALACSSPSMQNKMQFDKYGGHFACKSHTTTVHARNMRFSSASLSGTGITL